MKYFAKQYSIKTTLVVASLIGSTALFSASAAANTTPNFNNVSVSYVNFDVSDQSINGFGADFELMRTDKLFIAGDYVDGSESTSLTVSGTPLNSSYDFSILTMNLGYQFYQQGSVVAYASAGFMNLRSKVSLSSPTMNITDTDSTSGWNAQVGVRQALTERFELDANLRHLQGSGDNDQVISFGGNYQVSESFAIGLNYSQLGSDFSYVGAKLSYRF